MNNFIEIYEKVFDDNYCDQVINRFKIAEELGVTQSRQENSDILKIEKQDNSIYLPTYPLQSIDREIFAVFNDIFWGHCYRLYKDKFDILNSFGEHNSYNIKIQKTMPGEGYHIWHAEAANKNSSNRILAWAVYLNDDFEAGETEFLYQQYRYKPSKGDCIIFPAAFTHTHRGNPPIGGDKYIITGWVEF